MLLALLAQLLSYSVFTWVGFVAIAFGAARFFGALGMFAGQLVIAVIVSVLDVRWVQAAMHVPGWDGTPDMDFVFMLGLLLRVLLINTVLLVVTIPALQIWRRRQNVAPPPGIT